MGVLGEQHSGIDRVLDKLRDSVQDMMRLEATITEASVMLIRLYAGDTLPSNIKDAASCIQIIIDKCRDIGDEIASTEANLLAQQSSLHL
jgi:hypothetical protein